MVGSSWRRALVRLATILVVVAVVSGCVATRAPVVLTTSFDPQAASFINASGRAKVSG